jgi:hypothetical protein
MGLIWNTAATQQMIETLLLEFSGDGNLQGAQGDSPPIARWQGMSDQFDPGNRHELKDIAAANGLFGGGQQHSSHDDNWQAWLGYLGTSNQPASQHEALRALIFNGLTTCDEIVFSVIPRSSRSKIKVTPGGTAINDDGTRTKVIYVETPTARAVALRLRELRRRRDARAKAKKKR